jgi:hypothetical protein
MGIESYQCGRGDDGGFESLDQLRDGPDNVDDWKDKVGERIVAAWDHHPSIMDVVIVYGGWQSDITVGILNQKWSSQFERHMAIPHVDTPPYPPPHFSLNNWPWPRLAIKSNILRYPDS